MTDDEAQIAAAEALQAPGPQHAFQLLHAAELCLRQNDATRAGSLALLAVTIAPQDARAARVLSGILALQGRRDDALQMALAAVRLQPSLAEPRLHLGSLLAANGDWRQAAEQLAAYVAGPAPDPAGWRLLSAALQELGRSAKALEAIDQALSRSPDNAEFRIHRASLLAASGRHADALDELRRAASLAPDDPRLLRSRSGLHAVLGDHGQALADAQRAATIAPHDADCATHLAELRRTLGLATDDTAAETAAAAYWTAPPARTRRARPPPPRLATLIAIQARIVFALMLREMRTRFGRTRLGYVWAVLEPVSHVATLGSVFALLNHAPPPVGDNLFVFYLTGLLPFLMFSHVSVEVMTSLHANGAVLQIPLIKRVDVILSRALLHLATEIMVGVVVFGGGTLLGWQGRPADILTAAQAVLCLWMFATGIGAINIVLSELMPAWETFYAALVRLLYFASGIYYAPIAMPSVIRDVLVYNPVLQCVEWFRSGFYAQYEPHWLDRGYAMMCAMAALLVGLSLERAARRLVPVTP